VNLILKFRRTLKKKKLVLLKAFLKTTSKHLQAERMSATPEIGAKVADIILNINIDVRRS
jgi:hypothetical protein